MKAPSARSTASSSILPRSAASTIGTGSAGGVSSLKPVAVRSPASAAWRKSSVSRTLLSGFSKGIPFQPSTMRSEEEPMPSTKRPSEALGERRRLLRQQRRTALEDADDPGAEPRPLGPGGAQRQRREAVGPGGLAAPEVGVAGRLGPLHVLLVIGQRRARAAATSVPNAPLTQTLPMRYSTFANLETAGLRPLLEEQVRVLRAERSGEEEALAVVAVLATGSARGPAAARCPPRSSRSRAPCRAATSVCRRISPSPPSSSWEMNERSILSTSTGNWRRWASEE